MAIYNNREVTVMGPTHSTSAPETIRVSYLDGSQETVSMGRVQFTEAEKKEFQKAYPSRFDGVNTISDEDVRAVRLGVTPPSDPSLKTQAEAQARAQMQQEESRKNSEKAKAEADKRVKEELDRPAVRSAPAPLHGDAPFATTEPVNSKNSQSNQSNQNLTNQHGRVNQAPKAK